MTRRLDYQWHLRQVMAGRGMFATTDLIGPLAERGDPAVVQPGLPAGRRAAGTAEPEDPDGAAGHPGLLGGGPDRAGRASARPRPRGRRRPPAPRPASAACGPGGPASTGRVTVDGALHDRAVSDPAGLITDLVTAVGPRLGREQVQAVVAAVAGGRAKSRRLAARAGRAARGARRRQVPGAPGRRGTARRPARRGRPGHLAAAPARSAAGRSGASSAAARTGTARPACGTTSRAPPAGRTGPSPPGTGQGGRGARSARTTTAVTRSPSSTASSPPWIPAPGGKPSPRPSARRLRRPSYQQKLAWALEDNPALLTGDGHLAPLRAIPRFIEMLHDAGVAGVVRPACGRCGRVVRIDKPLDGVRVCRTCIAHSRTEPCARCGAVREPVTRDGQGQAGLRELLHHRPGRTWKRAPAAGAAAGSSRRTADGPLCPGCPSLPVLTCSVCGQTAPCGISRATGKPWCPACQRTPAACSACGRHEADRLRHPGAPALRRLHPAAALGRLPRLQRPGSSQSRPVRPLHHQRPARPS